MASSRRSRTALLVIAAVVGVTAVISLLLYLAISNHVILARKTVAVTGQSMYPTLRDGETVTLNQSAYSQNAPTHGDLVYFLSPLGGGSVMRVVAIPGDRLHITGGVLYLNGHIQSEPFLPEKWTYNNNWPASGSDVLVPAGGYFVLGDNRNHSADSRVFGFINLDVIAGRIEKG